MKAIKISPTGAIEHAALAADEDIRIHQLRNAVDGEIETIHLNGFEMVIDNEAAFKPYPLRNRVAEQILQAYQLPDQLTGRILGTAVLVSTGAGADLPLFVDEFVGLFARP